MGLVTKMKAQTEQIIPVCPGCFHLVLQEGSQDAPVFQQGIIDTPDRRTVAVAAFLFIIEQVPAVVVTEFFIYPSPKRSSTAAAGSVMGRCCFHFIVFFRNQITKSLSVCKRFLPA
jgi:hypothetical protein